MRERSVGIVPLQQDRGHLNVLLIHHRAGHWSLPKGHLEAGESDKQAAERELREETGLFVTQYFPAPPVTERYTFEREGRAIEKEVVYFLAEVAGGLRLQQQELQAARWIPVEAAQEQMTFPEGKQLIADILERLS